VFVLSSVVREFMNEGNRRECPSTERYSEEDYSGLCCA